MYAILDQLRYRERSIRDQNHLSWVQHRPRFGNDRPQRRNPFVPLRGCRRTWRPTRDRPIGQRARDQLGMSNTTQEFSAFKKLADADPLRSPKVAIVDVAQGGKASEQWIDPKSDVGKQVWETVRLIGMSGFPSVCRFSFLRDSDASSRRETSLSLRSNRSAVAPT